MNFTENPKEKPKDNTYSSNLKNLLSKIKFKDFSVRYREETKYKFNNK